MPERSRWVLFLIVNLRQLRIAKKCLDIQHQEDSEVQGRMDTEFSI
jgi:hypothetical protein